MKKYLVKPGTIISQEDGQPHFIGSNELMRLYGVRPSECYTGSVTFDTKHLIVLEPRFKGDYREWLRKKTNIDEALKELGNKKP